MSVVWPAEQSEMLRDLCAGIPMSSRDIASAINNKFNTSHTRMAIIGRAARMGLSLKLTHADSSKKDRAPRAPREHRAHVRIVRANGNSNRQRVFIASETEQYRLRCVEIEPRNLSLADLEDGDCRYPGNEAPFLFCGHPRLEGSSYCAPHHHLCWEKPKIKPALARKYHGVDFARGAA